MLVWLILVSKMRVRIGEFISLLRELGLLVVGSGATDSLLLPLPQYPAIATLTQSNLEFHMAVVKAGSLQFLPHPSCY